MTKQIKIGNVFIGGKNKIAIQSMTNTATNDVVATVNQIKKLQNAGCDIIRVAVADKNDALAIKEIKKQIQIPLVADIHFDYKLAILSIENGADKIRINPGNIDSDEHLAEVIECAKKYNVAIRIGVNGGSLNKDSFEVYGNTALALADSALRYIDFFEKHGFFNIVLSVKSSSVQKTIDACRIINQKTDYPQHIGVTESGCGELAKAKSAIGIGSLLVDDIGDTVRVSLTDDPVNEVLFAKEILKAVGKDKDFCEVISCPSCGRCKFDLIGTAQKVKEYVKDIKNPLKIAVMGCVVNGPGEAKEADLGLAGGNGKVVFFKKGQVYRTVVSDDVLAEFLKEIDIIK